MVGTKLSGVPRTQGRSPIATRKVSKKSRGLPAQSHLRSYQSYYFPDEPTFVRGFDGGSKCSLGRPAPPEAGPTSDTHRALWKRVAQRALAGTTPAVPALGAFPHTAAALPIRVPDRCMIRIGFKSRYLVGIINNRFDNDLLQCTNSLRLLTIRMHLRTSQA